MSPVFSARRRAEEFDSLVGGAPTAGRDDARYAEFLSIVAALRDVPAAQPRPEFVGSLRERLMLAAQTELVPAEEARLTLPVRRPRDRRIATAVGAMAFVGATTSMAVAAQSALPGDMLYPLKRAIENVQTGIAVDEGDRGSSLLANAEGRLDEISELTSDDGAGDADAIADTFGTFSDQAILASDLLLADYESTGKEDSISQLNEFTADSMATLSALESLVPPEARDELLHAVMVLATIDTAAQQACPQCVGTGITEIPLNLISAGQASGSSESADQQETTSAGPDKGRKKGERAPQTSGDDSDDDGSPEGVLQPPTTGDNPGTTDGDGKTDDPSDPIGDLTQGLIGGENSQPTSNPSGLPDPGEVLDDVTDPLLGDDGN
jgi:hypothetical protein